MLLWIASICFFSTVLCDAEHPPAVHFTLQRRGGPFAPNWVADLDYLLEQLKITESRFNFTRREVKGNKIVRIPKERPLGGSEIDKLIGEFGRNGNWFAQLKIGTPPQTVELDIDMLTRDFIVKSTSSQLGSKFEDFFSSSYAHNPLGIPVFPNCEFPSESILLPTCNKSITVSFAHCKPRKQSLETLKASGAVVGLAPSDSLSQLKNQPPTIFDQLKDNKIIREDVISLTLINGMEGILTIGGTIQEAMQKVEHRIEEWLEKPHEFDQTEEVQDPLPDNKDTSATSNRRRSLEQQSAEGESQEKSSPEKRGFGAPQKIPTFDDLNPLNRAGRAKPKVKNFKTWKDAWKWSPLEGAAGWWQILMRGIWADSVKILKNQPSIIDVNTPFILAPPLAAKAFYASISGSYRLRGQYSNFYAYPCNNPPFLHFEFAGWRFPTMRGTKSKLETRGPNGKFSLGKVSDDSGYCVGAVVETRMGVADATPVKKVQGNREPVGPGMESGMLAGNGLRDAWVLGEPLFRGIGLVFDMTTKEVGLRTY